MAETVDQWLNQVYGTTGASDDIEKTAQDMMLQKLAEQENIDLSGLSEDQMDALAAQVIEDMQSDEQGDGEPVGQEQPQGEEASQEEAEAQAKFAEADFLGRVMAHSYTQELRKIAEEEAKKEEEEEEKKEKAPAPPPFIPKKDEEAEKTAGPIASAIMKLGGQVGNQGNTAAYIEKMAEARAQEIAYTWLKQNGLVE